jgi:hypothetical protein
VIYKKRSKEMKKSSIFLACILMIVSVFLFSGCNSTTLGNATVLSGSGRLQAGDHTATDGSYIDDYTFTPQRDGYVTILMNSSSIDAYLLVYQGTNDTTLLGSNDDSGPGTDAVLTIYVQNGVTYMARFTSSGAGAKTGDYTYSIRYSDRSVPADTTNDTSKPVIDNNTKKIAQ